MRIGFDGYVCNGVLKLHDEEEFKHCFRTFEGKKIRLSIEKGNKRSTQQNRYLWGICYKILADYTGYTEKEIHAYCKAKFSPIVVEILNKRTGETSSMLVGDTTTELTTIKFMEYKEKIQHLGAELGCQIPDPEEWIEEEKE